MGLISARELARKTLQPLDLVRTPKGAMALVTEINSSGCASLEYLGGGNPTQEKNAWWASGLEVVDSLPHLLAVLAAHPFGDGKKAANVVFRIRE